MPVLMEHDEHEEEEDDEWMSEWVSALMTESHWLFKELYFMFIFS